MMNLGTTDHMKLISCSRAHQDMVLPGNTQSVPAGETEYTHNEYGPLERKDYKRSMMSLLFVLFSLLSCCMNNRGMCGILSVCHNFPT